MPEDRPQSVGEWRQALEGGAVVERPPAEKAEQPPVSAEPIRPPAKSGSGLKWAVAVILLVAVGGRSEEQHV